MNLSSFCLADREGAEFAEKEKEKRQRGLEREESEWRMANEKVWVKGVCHNINIRRRR